MKKILTATALALVLSTSAMASPSQSDMNQVFNNQETLDDVFQLSNNEMQETKGEYWNVVVAGALGGVGGATSYGVTCSVNNNCTTAGYAWNTAVGVGSAGYGSTVSTARAVYGVGGSMVNGVMNGAAAVSNWW